VNTSPESRQTAAPVPLFPAPASGARLSAPVNFRVHGEGSRARVCADRHGRSQMMTAQIFRGVLVRERKRADRSGDPFMLLLVDLTRIDGGGCWAARNAAIDAVAAARRETDVLGWFKDQWVIGLIVPHSGTASTAAELELRVRSELSRRLGASTVNQISLKVHLHEEAVKSNFFEPVDLVLGDVRGGFARASIQDGFKRVLDIVGSLILLIALSPVMLVIAFLIKATSRGPVFFKQTRIGYRGKPFQMLKFRSMRPNAGNGIHQDYVTWFIKSSGKQADGKDPGIFKITNDPRITGIGRILRNSSLDELPQFLNVLRGEMSLVGPRPPLSYEVEQYKAWHCRRVLEAKPGITGLWQVTGRSRTTFDEMVRLDLRYARSYSLWTDIKILLATPKAVISGKGAC
jgi:lipopolysaccharide/colanic/teichoic acid biosynthesis glycosyltransferase